MKIQILTVLAIACATGTQAASFDDYARVINVQERYSGSTPASGTRTVCEPGQQVQSNNYGAGTAIGAIAGGLIGSQVGKGCWRHLNSDPPCRSNIDPGRIAEFGISNCG